MPKPDKLTDLKSFGLKSESMLADIGITSVDDFLAMDPYDVYAQLVNQGHPKNLNMMYAILSAHDDMDWVDIARDRKMEILLRLDDMGLAPD